MLEISKTAWRGIVVSPLILLSLSCATSAKLPRPNDLQRAVLQVAMENLINVFDPRSGVVSETISPSEIQGVASFPLAKKDTLFADFVAANQKERLDLSEWLRQIGTVRQVTMSELLKVDDDLRQRFPAGVLAFSKPVFDETETTALVWASQILYVPAEFGGPMLAPDDVVFRLERSPAGWRIARTYAFSPD